MSEQQAQDQRSLRVALMIRKWSVRGGNERVAVELGRHLIAAGHRVHLICQKIDRTPGFVPERVERLIGPSFDPTLAMLSFAWSASRTLARLRRASAIDVAIGFNHTLVQDVYRLGGGTHAEFLAATEGEPGARGGPLLDRAAAMLERARFRPDRFKLLVAPSERVKGELIRHYAIDPARIRVLPNGIDLDRFRPATPTAADRDERARIRAEWGASMEEPLLLFVGQDPQRKGFATAVEVAHALGHRMVVVGKAPRPTSIPSGVIWDRERSDIEACYRSSDLLIAPSRYDPFGGAILEATCSGLLAVATDRIGSTETFIGTPLEALRIADPKDSAAMVRAAKLALDPARRPALLAAAEQVRARSGRAAWGERMELILREVSK
jgi:UDP-glucose:(heptosyl)LPS alpha-1,3-glucosyltransferase